MYPNIYFDVGLGVGYTGARSVAVVAERREPALRLPRRIFPEHIGPDEPLVPEFRDHRDAHVPWRLGAWLDDLGRHHCLLLYDAN
ncbi:hypothetical protein [Microtetraspora glauca]|uniref:Uncharacterized protein n=1 Tax=Microtetraspora glauca TaxID=1996 RepID=A0ABV3GT32_MICGL